MPSEEAVGAYLDGKIGRRTLIRRLVAAGVSMGAAVSYAHVLQPQRAAAAAVDCHHGMVVSIQLVESSLQRIIREERLLTRVTVPCTTSIRVEARLLRPNEPNGYTNSLIGQRNRLVDGADRQRVYVPLTRNGVIALTERPRRRVQVNLFANTVGSAQSTDSDTAVLT